MTHCVVRRAPDGAFFATPKARRNRFYRATWVHDPAGARVFPDERSAEQCAKARLGSFRPDVMAIEPVTIYPRPNFPEPKDI